MNFNRVRGVTRVIYSGTSAEQKLKQLGLDVQDLHEVLLYGAAEANTYTENDAKGAGEHARWSRHVRRASELYVPRGWQRIDPDCQPTLVHPSNKWCLVVSSGNNATGIAYARPTTKNPKGRSIRRAVEGNAELALYQPHDIEPALEGLRQTWMLMTYVNVEDEIQAEVSLPREMEGEYITDWTDRVLLPTIDPTGILGSGEEEPPSYDFSIVRK
jgi:hypothetical protein